MLCKSMIILKSNIINNINYKIFDNIYIKTFCDEISGDFYSTLFYILKNNDKDDIELKQRGQLFAHNINCRYNKFIKPWLKINNKIKKLNIEFNINNRIDTGPEINYKIENAKKDWHQRVMPIFLQWFNKKNYNKSNIIKIIKYKNICKTIQIKYAKTNDNI